MKSTFTLLKFPNWKSVYFPKAEKWPKYPFYSLKSFLFACLLFASTDLMAQTFPPASSCTSKDLALVAATLPYNKCETCTGGNVTKTLTVAIANKTGSTRTSFAFWATLVILNPNGDTASVTNISKCFSTIPKNATTSYIYGDLTFQCGQSLILTNIWEAWTDASPNSTCPTLLNSTSTINPKCGTLPMLNIVAGDDANYNVTNATCTTSGSIQVSPFGGAGGPYTVTISNVNTTTIAQTKTIAAGASYTFTGLVPGVYTFGITDGNNCAPVVETRTVASTGTVSAPTISSTPATCSAAGTSTISNYNASYSYAFTPSGPSIGAGGLISGMTVGTSYTVTATNGSCTSTASASFSNAAMLPTPAIPTITSVPPTCSADGSSTISNYSASNTYAFTPSGPSVGAGGLISGMTVGTSYTVTSNNGSCTSAASASFSNAAMLATPATPTITSTPATCSAAGTSTISNYSASNTYAFTPSGPSVGAGGLISGMTVGTSYTVTSNNGSCTSAASAPFSNAANLAAPTFTVCIVQPSLCSKGSLTINASGGTGFTYSIDGTDFSNTTGVFSNLGAASVTSVQVKNSDGCASAAVSCDNLVSDCAAPQAPVSVNQPSTQISSQTTVSAYPNPFNDQVKFVVKAPQSGNGTLEVFNVLGQKIKTVYHGFVAAGTNNFQLNLPGQKNATLIYRFTMGSKAVTGKLLQINQ